jgi:hypothetical protein
LSVKTLKRKKPNELAVVQSIKFELVTNLIVLGSCFAQEVAVIILRRKSLSALAACCRLCRSDRAR